ncbi:DinB family protein [Silvibacterium sp.]|uniref:DinB family protein n=1 Tax=Silvibacterium sp. TaxID=1964179 RepID=UPI0039E4517B
MTGIAIENPVLTPEALLEHWQGHRRLTRRTIDAFPEDKLFQFSLGGMRTFGEMACEFLGMPLPIVHGMTTDTWAKFEFTKPTTKAEVLAEWDAQTRQLNEEFPAIQPARFSETMTAFGQWQMTGTQLVQYAIENEVHHRGQGYVYLRSLGIEPPHFWERD